MGRPPKKLVTGVDAPEMAPKRSGEKVTVACKIGVAWIQLQLCQPKQVDEVTQTGIRTVTQWFRTGNIVRVRGTSYPRGTVPEGFIDRPEMIGGYALTHNVDREFYEQWKKQNSKSDMVLNDMIFAAPRDQIKGYCLERKSLLSGLEPLMQAKKINGKLVQDPRAPRSMRGEVSNVQIEESRNSKREAAAETEDA